MYNTFNYNSSMYNGLAFPTVLAEEQDDIVFNGYSFQDASSRITSSEGWDNAPAMSLKTFEVPREDGEGFISSYKTRKTIQISGVLKKGSESLLNDEIDTMKKNLMVDFANLDIKVNGVIRRFVATLVNPGGIFGIRQHYNIDFIPYTLQFVCLIPYGRLLTSEAETLFDETALSLTKIIANEGSAETQPVFTVILSAASGVSKITITNSTTSESISITKTFFSGDLLQVDSVNKTVKINGVAVDYEGVFPRLDVDSNSIILTVTGTSATYTFTTLFTKQYQ